MVLQTIFDLSFSVCLELLLSQVLHQVGFVSLILVLNFI
jgi:hypothetical protein